jgi:hypothetical protein
MGRPNTSGPRRAAATEGQMKNGKKDTNKKSGTLRPWLIDVAVEHLR